MPPTVDNINVEVGASLPKLDQNMRAVEQRVDRGARRMEQSVARVDRRMNMLGMGGGRGMQRGMQLARMPSSLMTFGQAGLTSIIAVALFKTVDELSTLFIKTGGALRDFDSSIRKAVKQIESGDLWGVGNRADWAWAMVSGQQTPDESKKEAMRAKSLARLEQDVAFDERAARATTESERKLVAYDRAVTATQRWLDSVLTPGLLLAEQIRLMKVAEARNRIAAIERDRVDKPETMKSSFFTGDSIFGQFKLGQHVKGKEVELAEKTQENTKETAKQTRKMADAFTSGAFVPFA